MSPSALPLTGVFLAVVAFLKFDGGLPLPVSINRPDGNEDFAALRPVRASLASGRGARNVFRFFSPSFQVPKIGSSASAAGACEREPRVSSSGAIRVKRIVRRGRDGFMPKPYIRGVASARGGVRFGGGRRRLS